MLEIIYLLFTFHVVYDIESKQFNKIPKNSMRATVQLLCYQLLPVLLLVLHYYLLLHNSK